MENLRIGIVGLGIMGQSHARNITEGNIPGLQLAAVCDSDPSILEKYPDATPFTDSGEMIRSGKIDAILIATPHYSHTTIGIDALQQGLHTLVEKPISVHKADAEALLAAHTDPQQIFAAMFNQRLNPHYLKLREMIQSGELGELRRIVWNITDWFRTETYYASGGWRATWEGEGGGVLLNQCPHQLDLWQWLFGMPQRLRAFADFGRYHDIEVEDDVTAYMEYENGCKGVFITTTGEAPGTNRLEVTGERGKVVIEGKDGISYTRNEQPMSEWSKETDEKFTKPPVWNIQIPVSGRGPQHVGILKNFTNAVLKNEPLVAPAKEGIHSVELANAMLLSSLEDETVTLPISAEAYKKKLADLIANSTHEKKVAKPAASSDEDFASSF